MPKEEAIQKGAMALFGEKYADTVRVVTMDEQYSIELCGGTHVLSTGVLGQCLILSESGVAAGVRRIECVCAEAAEAKIAEDQELIKSISTLLKQPKDLLKSIESLQMEYNALKKKLEAAEQKVLKQLASELLLSAKDLNGVLCIGSIIETDNPDSLKKLANDLRSSKENLLVILAASIAGKASVAVGISDSLVQGKGLDANSIIKNHIAEMIQGGGGGQKSLATAGGQRVDQLAQVVNIFSKFL
jgi:alanyl-tRNA synthetase